MIVVEEVGILLGKGLVLVRFAFNQGVQLIALLFQRLELCCVDLFNCLQLIAMFLLFVGDLHVLLPVTLLHPKLALSELVEQGLLPALEGFVLLRLAQELLLDADNFVVLSLEHSLNVHDFGLITVDCVLQVLLH